MNLKTRVVVLTTCLAARAVFAETATVKGIEWEYEVVNGTATIVRPNQICTGKLVVPGKVGKYKVTAIGKEAFSMQPGPSAVKIPASVTSIGEGAFQGNIQLVSFELPPKLTSIPEALFHTCRGLRSVKIPASVKSIGVEAFAECKDIKAIAIPEGVKTIDRLAFRDCALLASVTIPASVASIGECPFINCSKLTAITVAKKNRAYKSVDGVLYTKDGKTLVECPAGIPSAAVAIPVGVTNILRFACSDCANLKSVQIPSSVTDIGQQAFSGCTKLSVVYVDSGDGDRIKKLMLNAAGPNEKEAVEKIKFEEKEPPKAK